MFLFHHLFIDFIHTQKMQSHFINNSSRTKKGMTRIKI